MNNSYMQIRLTCRLYLASRRTGYFLCTCQGKSGPYNAAVYIIYLSGFDLYRHRMPKLVLKLALKHSKYWNHSSCHCSDSCLRRAEESEPRIKRRHQVLRVSLQTKDQVSTKKLYYIQLPISSIIAMIVQHNLAEASYWNSLFKVSK